MPEPSSNLQIPFDNGPKPERADYGTDNEDSFLCDLDMWEADERDPPADPDLWPERPSPCPFRLTDRWLCSLTAPARATVLTAVVRLTLATAGCSVVGLGPLAACSRDGAVWSRLRSVDFNTGWSRKRTMGPGSSRPDAVESMAWWFRLITAGHHFIRMAPYWPAITTFEGVIEVGSNFDKPSTLPLLLQHFPTLTTVIVADAFMNNMLDDCIHRMLEATDAGLFARVERLSLGGCTMDHVFNADGSPDEYGYGQKVNVWPQLLRLLAEMKALEVLELETDGQDPLPL